MRKMISDHVIFANDLYSVRKELLVGERFNAICIRSLNGEYGGDFAKCFKSVEDDANTICLDFQKYRPQLYMKYNCHPSLEDLKKYMDTCMAFMDGQLYWMLLCDRYRIDQFRCIVHIDESEVDKLEDIDIRYGSAFRY